MHPDIRSRFACASHLWYKFLFFFMFISLALSWKESECRTERKNKWEADKNRNQVLDQKQIAAQMSAGSARYSGQTFEVEVKPQENVLTQATLASQPTSKCQSSVLPSESSCECIKQSTALLSRFKSSERGISTEMLHHNNSFTVVWVVCQEDSC